MLRANGKSSAFKLHLALSIKISYKNLQMQAVIWFI